MIFPSPLKQVILNHFDSFWVLPTQPPLGVIIQIFAYLKNLKKKHLPEVLRDVDTKGLPMGGTVFGLTGPAATRGGKVRCGIGTLVTNDDATHGEIWRGSVVFSLSLPQSVHDENHEGRACAVFNAAACGIACFFVVSNFECLSLLIPQILLNHKPQ